MWKGVKMVNMINRNVSERTKKAVKEENEIKKLRFCFLGILAILVVSTPMVVLADSMSRRNKIQSRGKIDFEEGRVVVDSTDLIYLADEIDILEKTYKVTIVDTLNRIGTYFLKNGSLTNDSESNEVVTEEEKMDLPFGNIKNGILLSQSVDSLLDTQAMDKDGNPLFYVSQEAADNRDLLHTTTENTGFPIFYQPITAESLTAGTAAWVDGRLIRGNGRDNASSYAQGFVDGQANAIDNLNVTYTYHYHEGDSENGGGCYAQVENQTECGSIVFNREYYRGHTCSIWCASFYEKEYVCSRCGIVTGTLCGGGGNSCGRITGQIGGNHTVTTDSWQPVCGYSQGQILTATIVY